MTDELNTVVVDQADKWPEAASVKGSTIIDTFGGQMEFEYRAMSYAEYMAQNEEVPDPVPPMREINGMERPDLDNPDHQLAEAECSFKRMVRAIDMCWRSLPGDNLGEKVKWVQENFYREGEIIHLYQQIMRVSGLSAGAPVMPVSTASVVKADPQSWATNSRHRVGYAIRRAGVELVFELSGLSQVKQNQIASATRPPDPPMKPKKNRLTGRPEGTFADVNDEKYRRACADMKKFERVLQLEAALPFSIPGTTNEDRHEWLGKRPAFEVLNLLSHLNANVTSYRERSDFI